MGHLRSLAILFIAGAIFAQVKQNGVMYNIQVEPYHAAQVDRGTIQGTHGAGTIDKDGQGFVATTNGEVHAVIRDGDTAVTITPDRIIIQPVE